MFFEQNQKHFVIQMVYRKKGVCMRFILCLLLLVLIMPGAFAFGKSAKTTDFCTQVQQTDSKYTFEDNGDKTLSGKVVTLKKGTVLPITLQTPIDTSVIQENDEVTATLNEDLKIDGAVVAKQNSVFYGRVVKAKSASNCMRGGKVKINFDKLVTTDEKTYVIETKPIDFVVSSEDKMMTIGQTAMQVVLMALYGIATFGVGAVIVAICFMATPNGLFPVFSKKGNDAVIPVSTPMEVSLDSSLNAIATY